MKKGLQQLYGVLPLSVLLQQGMPVDIAPPTGFIVAVGLGVLVVLGLLVAGIVFISILAIRAIKKKHTPKDHA